MCIYSIYVIVFQYWMEELVNAFVSERERDREREKERQQLPG